MGKVSEDALYGELGGSLARTLAEETQGRDVLKAEAYRKIAERSGREAAASEQIGVIAEKIMVGVAESISLDRPDLGITVLPGNPYQDVQNKVDFIIASRQRRRGVGVETENLPPEERSVGVQFTVNTSKREHKQEQIAKAKARGVHLDDIVYVAIDMKLLSEAIRGWEQSGKPLAGPFAHLPAGTRTSALRALFHEVLTPEHEASLLGRHV